jgi:hypothetical protein
MDRIVGPAPDPSVAGDPPDVRTFAQPADAHAVARPESNADAHPGLSVARATLAEPQPLAQRGLSHRAASARFFRRKCRDGAASWPARLRSRG